MQVIGFGQINFWDGGSLWIGLAQAPAAMHAHRAIQISVALAGSLRFREAHGDGYTQYAAALVPPNLPHAFDASGSVVANVFCEPESVIGRALMRRYGNGSVNALAEAQIGPAREALRVAYATAEPDEILNQRAREVAESLAGTPTVAAATVVSETDQRVVRAVEAITRRLERPMTLAEIAASVHLSPGRFRHLFISEMGIPFRRYLLWRRLQRALELGVQGASWAEAAHAANFADSAHLTRTCWRMFGIAPSALAGIPQPAVGRERLALTRS